MAGDAAKEHGVEWEFKILGEPDLKRKLKTTAHTKVKISETNLENLSSSASSSSSTSIEAFLLSALVEVSQKNSLPQDFDRYLNHQPDRIEFRSPFTLLIRDPSGLTHIDEFQEETDVHISFRHFPRSEEDNLLLGLSGDGTMISQKADPFFDSVAHSVTVFVLDCPNCHMEAELKAHPLDIPHFKEVIIMATCCTFCGYKTNEVKTGGVVAPKGKRIILKVTEQADLSRDILKSDSCSLAIPEIELELQPGTLGGNFTTIEGLMRQIYDQLNGSHNFSIFTLDDDDEDDVSPLKIFLRKLDKLTKGQDEFTLILEDCLGNSFIQNLYAPDDDPHMTVEEYERSWEENEEYGINDFAENAPEEEED